MRSATMLLVAAVLLAWWRRRERNERHVFEQGTVSELIGLVENYRRAEAEHDIPRAYALIDDILHVIEAERRRR